MNYKLCLFIICAVVLMSSAKSSTNISNNNCTISINNKTFQLYGKVQIVDAFPDLKVQVVNSFPDLKVQVVTSFPDRCGQWQFVESFPNIKVQFVESFPDIKVQFVESFHGLP